MAPEPAARRPGRQSRRRTRGAWPALHPSGGSHQDLHAWPCCLQTKTCPTSNSAPPDAATLTPAPPNPQTVTRGMKQPFPLTTSLKSPAQRGPFLNVQTILVLPTHLTPSLHWTWATPEGRNPFASVAPHPDHRMQPRHGPERMDGARPDPHDAPVPRGPLSPPPSCSGLSSQGSSAARDPGQASQPSLGCDCLPSCFTGSKSPRDDRGGRGVLPWSCAGPDLWAVAGRAEETARQGTSPPPVTFMTHGP